MKARILIATALLAAAATAPTLPAFAQGSDRLLTIFGNDPCPRDTICVRAPENERFRIPKELRGESGEAAARRWGDRAKVLEYAGASGTMSCSPSGAGGAVGCYRKLAREAAEERRAKGGDTPGIKF